MGRARRNRTATGERNDPGGEHRTPGGGFRAHALAAGWGLAEATFLPIVPDVWLSRVALRSTRRALATTMTATLGAVVGGAITRAWARRVPAETSETALLMLPSIDRTMVREVAKEMEERGSQAMLLGPLRGRPYKIYARAAGVQDQSAGTFLAWSVPARWPRFALLALLSGVLASRARQRGLSEKVIGAAHLAGWVAFYAWYFATVGRGDDRPASGSAD